LVIELVMAGLVPAIHVLLPLLGQDVDARHKAGHDEWRVLRPPHPARKNSRSNFAVTSGFSSVRKCPEATGEPVTFVAHCFHVSSGVAAAVAIPTSPHKASIGMVIFLPASKSALSIS